jgi:hypothetical protein
MISDFYPLKWKQMAHDDILVDCLAAFDLPGGETLSFLVEETKSMAATSAETAQIEKQVAERRRKQAGKDVIQNMSPKHPRPSLTIAEPVEQVLMRPPKVDESQFDYARDFFINQASVIALEFAMIRQRTSFADIEGNLINLTPSDDPEVLAYRERALQAWIRGTRTYWECARNELAPDAATAEGTRA